MGDAYRIYGSELSPYSIKVRSYFRYKGIAHEWREGRAEEAKPYQKLPLVPVVVTPADAGLQDSTPILDQIEAEFHEPSIHPDDDACKFLSALLEEFSDEWSNKWMFHYRWARAVDQESAALRLVKSNRPGQSEEQTRELAKLVRARMTPRVGFVGSNEVTAPQIEADFQNFAKKLEAHLGARPYCFGARPAFADFGLFGQLYNLWSDPTPGALLKSECPNICAWLHRMLDPEATGVFESWPALAPTLLPILKEHVGAMFAPWTLANAHAIESGAEEFSVELASGTWTQKPQKYHARSLKMLRARYEGVPEKSALDEILQETNCQTLLRG